MSAVRVLRLEKQVAYSARASLYEQVEDLLSDQKF